MSKQIETSDLPEYSNIALHKGIAYPKKRTGRPKLYFRTVF